MGELVVGEEIKHFSEYAEWLERTRKGHTFGKPTKRRRGLSKQVMKGLISRAAQSIWRLISFGYSKTLLGAPCDLATTYNWDCNPT